MKEIRLGARVMAWSDCVVVLVEPSSNHLHSQDRDDLDVSYDFVFRDLLIAFRVGVYVTSYRATRGRIA